MSGSVAHFNTRMAQPFRWWAVMSMVAGMLLLALPPVSGQDGTPAVKVLSIDGTITPPMAQYIQRGIADAEDGNAAAIVLEIDTPGGLSSAMDDIDRAILESEVPVIAYVSPRGARAASAGVFITYASHVAAMAPGTSIGSASPVASDGSDMTDTMEAKVTNDAVSNIRNLAEYRGRNADWAERAVREAVNITADEALDLGVINLIAPDIATLLADVDGMQVEMSDGSIVTLSTAGAATDGVSMNGIEKFLQLISDPTIAYLLLSFGGLGLFLELSNPGGFIPGIVGVISLVLGLYALGTLPVNWTGAALIGIAFLLFFLDIFVSSFGILLIGGLASFIVGSYLLVDSSAPGYDGVWPPVIWTAAALVAVSAALIGTAVVRSMRRKPVSGKSSLIGEVGTVRQSLDPDGMVFMQGELWIASVAGAVNGTDVVPVGTRVQVQDVKGLRLFVVPADAGAIAMAERAESLRGGQVLSVPGGVRTMPLDSRG